MLIKIVIVAVLLYCLLVGYLYVFQRRILFVPGTTAPNREDVGVPEMREIELLSADGLATRSWYHPAVPGKPTIVYFQGNAGTIGGRGYKARHFIDRGYGILLVGYRGYGGNPGEPSEAGLILDGRAALSFLGRGEAPPANIVLYGESLGSGVAVALAAETRVGAVILEAPYTSIEAMAAARYWFIPIRYLLKDTFDSISRIDRIGAPLLVLHGEKDNVIDVAHGRRLFEAAVEPKRLHLFSNGDHSDLYDHDAATVIFDFVEAMWDSPQITPALSREP